MTLSLFINIKHFLKIISMRLNHPSFSNSRREFLKKAALSAAGIGLSGMKTIIPKQKLESDAHLRVITYNIYEVTGWPRDNSTHVRNTGQMPARIAQELLLYDPDIVQFSEAPRDHRVVREIAEQMNMSYCFLPSAGHWPGAILTKHKFLEFKNVPLVSGEREDDLFTRHWGKAHILLHNAEEIIIHSAHLYPHDRPENNAIRAREITHMLETLEQDTSSGKNVLILADLNHRPDMAGYARWMEAGWKDTFSSEDESAGYTFRADEPYQRIDYVLAYGPLAERIVEGRPLFEGAFRTNPDDPGSYALSDHLPHLAVFGLQ